MSLLLTRNPSLGALVQYEEGTYTGFCRKEVTAYEAASKSYTIGTVLGVDEDGKYKVLSPAATDGSEVFAGIYIGNPDGDISQTVAATTNTTVTILFRGPASISKGALVFGSTVDTDAEKTAIYTAMEAANIQVLDTVE